MSAWMVRPLLVLLMLGLAVLGPPSQAQVLQQPSPRGLLPWTCMIVVGDPATASPVLTNDNDTPSVCSNDGGTDITISTVACYANAGSPTVTPIVTGGTATSLVTGAITCGTASWAAGTVQTSPVPVLHSFSGTGATCSSTPCTLDVNITAADGTAKYLVVKIAGTRR